MRRGAGAERPRAQPPFRPRGPRSPAAPALQGERHEGTCAPPRTLASPQPPDRATPGAPGLAVPHLSICAPPNAEAVVVVGRLLCVQAREHHPQLRAVGAHPLGGQAVAVGVSEVPALCEEGRPPRAPGIWRLKNAPSTAVVETQRHQITLERRVVRHIHALAVSRITEHAGTVSHARRPTRRTALLQSGKERPRPTLAQTLPGGSCQSGGAASH